MNMSIYKEILNELSQPQKRLSPKYFYDEIGSKLFEKICELKVYYPTRSEKEILGNNYKEMAHLIGGQATIVEPGSGNAQKVRILLRGLENPCSYVPIEISREILERSTGELQEEFPDLRIHDYCDDFFSKDFFLDKKIKSSGKTVIFFPGSTIGNFSPSEALEFLKKCRDSIGPDGCMVVGVDLKKDKSVLELAYDDPQGITAAFNLNILNHLNKKLNLDFNQRNFYHRAFYSPQHGRVEMHLVSRVFQKVYFGDQWITFQKGETIHTESSYKYSIEDFRALAFSSGFLIKKLWKDSRGLFCVYFLTPRRD